MASVSPDIRRRVAAAPTDLTALDEIWLSHHRAGDDRSALPWLDRTNAIAPADPSIAHNRGEILARLGADDAAAEAYATALARAPGQVASLIGYGNMHFRLGRFASARAAFRAAIALNPTLPIPYNNLGNTCRSLAGTAGIIPLYDRALAISPTYVEGRWNRGLARLAQGDLPRGFSDYEARWQLPGNRRSAMLRPWAGETSPDIDLVVRAEQGFGDTIQFARFLEVALARVGRLTFLCQEPLVALLRASLAGLDIQSLTAVVPGANAEIALLSLPRVLSINVTSIPAAERYLQPSAAASRRMAAREIRSSMRVGLCWSGARREHDPDGAAVDRRRSLPVHALEFLAAIGGISFVSLQMGHSPPEWMDDPMPSVADFDDTAALIESLDMVISVDSAVAHLAAALGKPTWIMSRFDACWRWLEGRSDSPWYPTVRLYRQPKPGDWSSVVATIAAKLRDEVALRPRGVGP